MHPTLSNVNVKTSLKLFFNVKFGDERNIPIVYNKIVSDPYTSSNNMEEVASKWIAILFRSTEQADVSELTVEIFCCTRKDVDNVLLEALVDEVKEVLFPEDGHLTIPLYNVKTETQIGDLFFLKRLNADTGNFTAIDGTNYSILSVPIKWIAVI